MVRVLIASLAVVACALLAAPTAGADGIQATVVAPPQAPATTFVAQPSYATYSYPGYSYAYPAYATGYTYPAYTTGYAYPATYGGYYQPSYGYYGSYNAWYCHCRSGLFGHGGFLGTGLFR